MARNKKTFKPMRSKRSGMKTNKRIASNNKVLKSLTKLK